MPGVASGDKPAFVGKYRVDGVIGRGAVGIVYKGYDPNIDRPVALKTIRSDVLEDVADREGLLKRFGAEARSAGRCQHPNIVTVFDYVEHKEAPFIVMEYLPASTLENVTRLRTLLPLTQVAEIVAQLLSALEHAHGKGVVHRDIKPANILCPAATSIKVGDFGVARIENLGLTSRGGLGVLGTPNYMSPEQFLGRPVDARSDLFSVGVILFQLVTGQKPFVANDVQDLIRCLLNEQPPTASMLRRGLPPRIDQVVNRALAKNAADRFPSAAAFADELSAAFSHSEIDPVPAIDLTAIGLRSVGEASDSSQSGLSKTIAERLAPSTLGHIEEALARTIGPIARLLVRRASQEATDVDELLSSLANRIPHDGEAKAFRKEAERSLRSDPGITSLQINAAVSNIQIRMATDLLVPIIGPIGKIVATREAKTSIGLADYFEHLSRHIKDEKDRKWFLSQQDTVSKPGEETK